MSKEKYNLKKGCTIFLLIYLVCAFFFLYIARDQIRYTQKEEYTLAGTATSNAGVLADGSVVSQKVKIEHQYLTGVKGYFSTYEQKCSGSV